MPYRHGVGVPWHQLLLACVVFCVLIMSLSSLCILLTIATAVNPHLPFFMADILSPVVSFNSTDGRYGAGLTSSPCFEPSAHLLHPPDSATTTYS